VGSPVWKTRELTTVFFLSTGRHSWKQTLCCKWKSLISPQKHQRGVRRATGGTHSQVATWLVVLVVSAGSGSNTAWWEDSGGRTHLPDLGLDIGRVGVLGVGPDEVDRVILEIELLLSEEW
jgi:hypothetical protein